MSLKTICIILFTLSAIPIALFFDTICEPKNCTKTDSAICILYHDKMVKSETDWDCEFK